MLVCNTIKVASVQWFVRVSLNILSRDLAENFVELELNDEGDEVSDVACISCYVKLGSSIKIFLSAKIWWSNTWKKLQVQ